MTIEELHENEELRRHEFPVAGRKNFLAHAAVCPLPRRVAEAIERQARDGMFDDQEKSIDREQFTRVRSLAAELIGADSREIALVGPTSLGLSFIAAGLNFRRNDNIIVYFDDYPSNVYPWTALAERGVQVRLLNVKHLGRIRDIDVLGQVDENTRLVALASNHFISGWRIDLEKIGRALKRNNILFCLDAIQTLGAFPTPVEHVDFLAADAHKWLLGPCAAGILYVKRELQDRLRPIVHGWHNVRCPDFVSQETIVFPPDARRYEAGSFNLSSLVGLQAALELLHEVGIENIASDLLKKRRWLTGELESRGWQVLNADAPDLNCSGIVSARKEGIDLPVLSDALATRGIVTSLRTDREKNHYLRLSPHFYNTQSELERFIEALDESK